MRVLTLAVLLVACGTPPKPVVPNGSEDDAGSKTVSCPPSYEATQTVSCVLGQHKTCSYAEGDCTCVAPPQCGGAYIPPGPLGGWSCAPRNADGLRVDGCPVNLPAKASQCAKPGQTCAYGACDWSKTTAACENGTWQLTESNLGPPP